MRDEYVCAVIFNDYANVIHLARFMMDAKGVPLKMAINHPRTRLPVAIHYRGTSSRGKKIYFYKEGNEKGEIRGG